MVKIERERELNCVLTSADERCALPTKQLARCRAVVFRAAALVSSRHTTHTVGLFTFCSRIKLQEN